MVAGLTLDFVFPGLKGEYARLGFFELTAAVGIPLRASAVVTGLPFDVLLPLLKGEHALLVGFKAAAAVRIVRRASTVVAGLTRQVLSGAYPSGEGASGEGCKNRDDESKLHGGSRRKMVLQ